LQSDPRGREESQLSTAPPGLDALTRFNNARPEVALAELTACCASPCWAAAVAGGRPYPSVDAVLERASATLRELDEAEVDKALAGHPRIGERPVHTLAAHASSSREQAGVADADADTLAALAEGNRVYERRFGHVYLVCADGRSASELLAVLRGRLSNDPATERRVLRGELEKINRLRLARLLEAS
jgi:2-oxo-4-hydroxy-4-carboxy-5-ureidoimidazoline decarboxylase